MPNHVTNKLIIGEVNADRLKEIRLAIAGTGIPFAGSEERSVDAIDFNKIIPMPPSLAVEASSIGELGFAHSHPEYAKYPFYVGDEGEKRWNELDEDRKAEALKLGEIYYNNLSEHGATTWYEWCTKHWNTKWGAYSIFVEDKQDENGEVVAYSNEIQFDTAWATPFRIIQKLSEMFPDAEFSVTYADEDMGKNCGRYTYQDGEEIESYQPEGGSDEAMELAIEVKNMQGEWRYQSEIDEENSQNDHTAEIENEAEAKANED